jgi:hypothetical protein
LRDSELEAGSWASTAARLALGPPAGQPATVSAAFTNASRQPLQTQAEARAQATFSLAPFTNVGVNDHFTSDDLPDYTQLQPAVTASTGEIAPTWTAGGGQAQAGAGQPWFGMLQSAAAPASDQSVMVTDPAKFLGDAKNQDSVFVGLAKDAKNYVMAWYSNVSRTSGFDLVRSGVLEPAGFQSYCCADVTMNPGDRFALEVSGNTITSWVEPGGTGAWRELLSTTVAPLLDLTSPAVLAQYHFAFGLRGDSAAMAAASFEGASDPG